MKIKRLLQPIDPPPHGLEKLLQALQMQQASAQTEPVQAFSFKMKHWQAATVLLVAGLWFGWKGLDGLHWPVQGEPKVSVIAALNVLTTTSEVVQQSSVVALPSNDPQVKMYWVMSEGAE